MPIFIFLHVLAMFIAVALAYGPAALLVVATQRKDVRALRAISSTNERVGPLVGIFFGLGIVLGLVSVFVYGFDPLQGWPLVAQGKGGGRRITGRCDVPGAGRAAELAA
jgi:hypothetical protein